MTRPRSHIAPPDIAGSFHCVQRCVRRAFLCGKDAYTGRCFEHRKAWVEARIHLIAASFAVSVYAYAVMSNHLHLVLRIDPEEAHAWGDDEVADRWLRLFPPRQDSEAAAEEKRMRLLAEPIARRANREDGCKGRFWEGRYKCQALCDERSVLAAMAYVDLNPIRAGIANRLDASAHTSAAQRIESARSEAVTLTRSLRPIAGDLRPVLEISTADYLQLLDWTGRALAPGKRGRIARNEPSILATVDRDADRWATRVAAFGCGWARAVGSAHDLIALAERLGQRWIKGVRLATKLG